MKKVVLAAVAGVFISLSSQSSGQGQFPLKYREFTEDRSPLRMWATQCLRMAPARSLPTSLRIDAPCFRATICAKEILLALDSSNPRAMVLYADANADGNLSDEKPLPGHKYDEQRTRFGPVSIALPGSPGGVAPRVVFEALAREHLHIMPAGFVSGEIRLNGESYVVAVVDRNLNGRYDDLLPSPAPVPAETPARGASLAPRPEQNADILGIDFNRNGTFEDYPEIWPLSKMLRIDNVYYGFQILSDGSAIRLQKITPPLGTLDLGCRDAEMAVWSDVCCQAVSGAGPCPVPAGKYTANECRLVRTDDAGKKWVLKSSTIPGGVEHFDIAPGKPVSFKMGTPLTAKITAPQGAIGYSARISATILGQAGEEYSAQAEVEGEQAKPPTVKILDEAGKVLATGSFEFG